MSGRLGIRRHGIGWQARYRLANGRERARTFDTLDEAVAWRTERLAERNRGVRYDPASSRITFGQLAERWAST